jgi:hypothetical protein
MKSYIRPLLSSLFLLTLTAACGDPHVKGSGRIETREFAISEAQQVRVCCEFEVTFEESNSPFVEITSDDNILDELEVRKKDGELRVGLHDHHANLDPSRGIQVRVGMPSFEQIEIAGGSKFSIDAVNTDHFRLKMNGESTGVIGYLAAKTFTVETNGDTKLTVESGHVELQRGEFAGDSAYHALGLSSERAEFDLAGDSLIEVDVSTLLEINALGDATIRYKGSPRIRKSTVGDVDTVAVAD